MLFFKIFPLEWKLQVPLNLALDGNYDNTNKRLITSQNFASIHRAPLQ